MPSPTIIRRLQVTAFLAGLGALGGVAAALALAALGTAVAQLFMHDGRVFYTWSAPEFAIAGAIGTPLLAWAALRRVPVWRAVLGPAMGGVLGTLVGLAALPTFQSVWVLPAALAAGISGAAVRLRVVHGEASPTRLDTGKRPSRLRAGA